MSDETDLTSVDEPVLVTETNGPEYTHKPAVDTSVDSELKSFPLNILIDQVTELGLNELRKSIHESQDLSQEQKEAKIKILNNGARYLFSDGYVTDTANNPDVAQYVEQGGVRKFPAGLSTNFKSSDDGKVSGHAITQFISSSIGYGKPHTVPCWKSGFTLKLSNFSPLDTMSLIVRITEERLEVGNRTKGIMFSADDVQIISLIVEFAIDHVIDCTIKNWSPAIIRENLVDEDFHHLAAMVLACLYPNGYPINYNCSSSECDYSSLKELEGDINKLPRLNFPKSCLVRNDKVSRDTFNLVRSDMNSVDINKVISNRENTCEEWVSAPINDGGGVIYKVVCKNSVYQDYRLSTAEVIAEIEEKVNSALTNVDHADRKSFNMARVKYINKFMDEIKGIKSINHIKRIIIEPVGKEPVVVEDPETLRASITSLCADPTIAKNLENEVARFKKETNVSFTGLTNYKCPKCGTTHDQGGLSYYPINIFSYFFDIMVLRSTK